MENYLDMQKASRNFFRACMRHVMEEFVREVNKNDHAELTEYLESRKEFVLEKFTQKTS